MILAGVGAVVVVLAVVVIVLLTRNHDANQTANGGPSPANNSAPASAPVSSATPPSSPPRSTSSAPPSSSAASPQDMAAALTNYFSLIPADLQRGFSLLTDNFKASKKQTFASYQSFWSNYRSATASNVQQIGPDRLSADITYVRSDGSRETDHHTYHMVDDNGVWKIDSEN